RIEHAEGRRGRQVSDVQEAAVGAVGDVEKTGRALDTLRRQHDLAGVGERGVVVELDHIGARAAAAAGEVAGGHHGRGAVGREVDARGETRVDLSQPSIAVAVEQVHSGVYLVVESLIEYIHPVRAPGRQALDGEMLGGQGRRGGARRGAEAEAQRG